MKAHLLTMSLATVLAAQLPAQRAASSEWLAYGGDPGGHRFAALDQITRTNVGSLQLAWVYRTGDLMNARGRFEATPLLIVNVDRIAELRPWSYGDWIVVLGDGAKVRLSRRYRDRLQRFDP